MNPISVLLVEDHAVVREGLRRMLELESDMRVVGEARNGRNAVVMACELHPDVVLMDIAMPGLNGLEATRQMNRLAPATKVIILTAHNEDSYITNALACGAAGFLLKQTSSRNVATAIREVANGNTYFSATIARRQARLRESTVHHHDPANDRINHLTSREVEVLQLIAEGKANKEMACDLGISIKTVEKHRGHLMEKLDIHDTASLTRYAISAGIIESSVQLTTYGAAG